MKKFEFEWELPRVLGYIPTPPGYSTKEPTVPVYNTGELKVWSTGSSPSEGRADLARRGYKGAEWATLLYQRLL